MSVRNSGNQIKNRIIQSAQLLIVAIAVSACVASSYSIDGRTFKSKEEASAYLKERLAEAEASISAGLTPLVDKKVLVVIPNHNALTKVFETRLVNLGKNYPAPGTPGREQVDFYADGIVDNCKSIIESIRKANIYQEVSEFDTDTMETNIQPSANQDVVTFYAGAQSAAATLYFQSAKFGKQVMAVDMANPSWAQRRISLINDLKAKALQ